MNLPGAVANPCNECPFRRTSARGWLGPMSADQWVALVLSDEGIACHMTIKEDRSWEGALQCRGAAIFRKNIAKIPRDKSVITGPVDRENIFSHAAEFLVYHEPYVDSLLEE